MSTQTIRSRALGAACALIASCFALQAAAFCRTTTCDPKEDPCEYDANLCELTGKPLAWTSSCVSFGVQKNASPLRNISFDTADTVIDGAFKKWEAAACPGGNPSIKIENFGAIECSEPEYNQDSANANVWIFRDKKWPYSEGNVGAGTVDSSALAVTAVTYNPNTGEIYDADVEINSENVDLTLTVDGAQYDLDSIVTHEAGHFLGLAHSTQFDATMYRGYLKGDTEMRTLSPDDEAGICTVYPVDRKAATSDCTPRHGFSSECASPADSGCCSTAPGRPTPRDGRGPWLLGAVTALVGAGALRRRRRFAVS